MKITIEIKEIGGGKLKIDTGDPEGLKDSTAVELIAYSIFQAYMDSMWQETQTKQNTPERLKSIENLAKIFIDFIEAGGDPKVAAMIIPGGLPGMDKEAMTEMLIQTIALKNKLMKKDKPKKEE